MMSFSKLAAEDNIPRSNSDYYLLLTIYYLLLTSQRKCNRFIISRGPIDSCE